MIVTKLQLSRLPPPGRGTQRKQQGQQLQLYPLDWFMFKTLGLLCHMLGYGEHRLVHRSGMTQEYGTTPVL